MVVNKDKLLELFVVQNTLNRATNGDNWVNGETKTGKEISFDTAILVETAEFIDSFDWKHWKHGENDFENAKVELIDLLHFILSIILHNLKLPKVHVNNVELRMPNLLNFAEEDRRYYIHEIPFSITNMRITSFDMVKHTYDLMNEENPVMKSYLSATLLTDLFKLMEMLQISFDEVYSIYISKNALNYFRLKNGYQNGSYKKMWDGKEDNVVMMELKEILTIDRRFNFDNMYAALTTSYYELAM